MSAVTGPFDAALDGLTKAEKQAVWAAVLFARELPDVTRLTPYVERVRELPDVTRLTPYVERVRELRQRTTP